MLDVPAFGSWRTNGDLILDIARLGYLRDDWLVLDPTYGLGVFWKKWSPARLVATDVKELKSLGPVMDFTSLGFRDGVFDAVVFDPPYKLNGTPNVALDQRYGVDVPTRWQDRMALCVAGITECVRVLGDGGFLLVKCQDQVCSGVIRWQTREFAAHAESLGMVLVDMLHRVGGRPQPAGRRQVHARRNYSTMLVLKKG